MNSFSTRLLLLVISSSLTITVTGQQINELWLQAHPANKVVVSSKKNSPLVILAKQELQKGWSGADGARFNLAIVKDKSIIGDGYRLDSSGINAVTDAGLLYGAFEILRRQQSNQPIIPSTSNPSYQKRILDHWDNMDGSVERGYAGKSIFWHSGPDSLVVTENDKRLWNSYARSNASIGINGTVVNNVNATPNILTAAALEKVQTIASVLRTYNITTYLSVNFSSPARLGALKNSDPVSPEVIQWWKEKIKEIYQLIPDFGGFVIKANSEGQPGPQDFGRTHAEGANMFADLLKPYGGIIMWRAFVYSPAEKDRAKQAYNEFMPLDGKFRENVIIQVKNGPVDFQPREPFSPLFGAMKKTSIMPEFQVTQEYLGHSYQLVFLAPMWEEVLKSETYQEGNLSTVAKVTEGTIFHQKYTAIAGVANIGLDSDWCGHPFAQANWYAFGRLAWNNQLSSEQIADEWIRQTFSNENADKKFAEEKWDKEFLAPVKNMMLVSRETAVNYSMPLGLHHLFAGNHHYGPGPWWAPPGTRVDWTPAYYHQADFNGIGFDRTSKGTNAVAQYHEPLSNEFQDINSCPEKFLLWFHHLPWTYKVKSGRILWDEICYAYDTGVKQVKEFQKTWDKIQRYVDTALFEDVQSRLRRQARDAQIWKDGCILYFQQYSRLPIPIDIDRPIYDLDYLEHMHPITYKIGPTDTYQ